MLRFFGLLLAALPAFATDPPGLSVAESDPRSSAPAGTITCPAGRFVPLNISGGKPALVIGNEAGLLEIYPLSPGEAINGVRYDEPPGAKVKRYTFPKGATHYAVAGDVGGTVTLQSIVNGIPDKDKNETAPTVAGKLVLTLTAPLPPPGPVTKLALTGYPNAGTAPLTTNFSAVGLDPTVPFSVSFGDSSPQVMTLPASHAYTAPGTYTATLAQGERLASTVVSVTGTPIPPPPPVVNSFRVIYVTESATALTKTQNAVINAAANVAYRNSKVTKTNNWPDWRSYDPQTPPEKDYPGLAAMWAAAKPAITTVPCVIFQVNDKITIESFPATAADDLALSKKYGGQ